MRELLVLLVSWGIFLCGLLGLRALGRTGWRRMSLSDQFGRVELWRSAALRQILSNSAMGT